MIIRAVRITLCKADWTVIETCTFPSARATRPTHSINYGPASSGPRRYDDAGLDPTQKYPNPLQRKYSPV